MISPANIQTALDTIAKKYPEADLKRVEKGMKQVAALWFETDGTADDFVAFCRDNFLADEAARKNAFVQISQHMESILGYGNKMVVSLLLPLHVQGPDPLVIDDMFGAFNPLSHLSEDMFNNKIAFYVLLNFPTYTLAEKTENADKWSREEWAYARLGDMFSSRVPGNLNQKLTEIQTKADSYISNYYIHMGSLVNDKMDTLFPKDMKLITHWNLRDELKTNYNGTNGLEKQRMIYAVMKNIINQTIPQEVIDNGTYEWNPLTNKLYQDKKEMAFTSEPDTRYQYMIDIFRAIKEIDPYSPAYPNYISRKFDGEMEMSQQEVEKLFTEYMSSPVVKDVAALISKRLGRPLEPFDIWYDGFKSRSSLNEDDLTKQTRAKYPDPAALKKDLPNILTKLGWEKNRADLLASLVTVDASRGAGHAWGSEMKGDNARLRTHIKPEGMDYKGYNIAVHEFGHNVEQTISLYDIDYYFMRGVPNTSFTEALAFSFQKRDLELLGIKQDNPQKEPLEALDNFWAVYEIMGVSLVDMKAWQWLYDHPDADAKQLKEAVVGIAKEVWNQYYAPVFGSNDEVILAIYSHMIDSPLYLSAYPIGHLIEFQLSGYFKDKPFAAEVERIYKLGRLTPQVWMKQAVGSEISSKTMIDAATEALKVVK
ncbi:MAG: hypothetical protein CVU05_04285 [Bacteroidetes bacterium HGW-Bacteroidetes-21]|nr:MAG: hypothetical protein CVU05_04285 [Bacteroidetes bacterium HGW-Bacteroidetes-21]